MTLPAAYSLTRIAPTPSGFLHLGNVLSFSITAALARKHGAQILLRIDDLDRIRVDQKYLQDIFDTLDFLQIPWDEGPRNIKAFESDYSQVHRLSAYQDALKQLSDNHLVFACICSRQQLGNHTYRCDCINKQIPLTEKGVSWRLVTDGQTELRVKTYENQITSAFLPADMHQFVVKRKDGLPAYQLTSVVDDLLYGTDLIVRGLDLWPSTLAQYQLATALCRDDFNGITFYHHPLLREASGKKLSKSAGSLSVRYLRENGKSPSDVFTLIASMLGINKTINSWWQLAGLG